MKWPWQQAEYVAMSKSPQDFKQELVAAGARTAYPAYPAPQQPMETHRKAPCERHLALLVCGVTAFLAALMMALRHLAGTHREPTMDWDIVDYSGCKDCHEAEFCMHAGNPGCGGTGDADAVTFDNSRKAEGCPVRPVLTIPRSYVSDIADLQAKGEILAKQMLSIMLQQGFTEYQNRGHSGSVQQCIHLPSGVSVHWFHLHSFCVGPSFDGMPGANSLCRVMEDVDDADQIAGNWSAPPPASSEAVG